MKEIKKYLLEANSFLFQHKKYILWYFFFITLNNIATFASNKSFDPYGLTTMGAVLVLYVWIVYSLLLPVFFYKKINNEPLTKKFVAKLFLKNTGRVFASFFGCVIIILIVMILLSIVGAITNNPDLLTKGFAENKDNSGFGFYPDQGIISGILQLIIAPFYFFPILYFLERRSFWSSVKHSFIIFSQKIGFILPLIVFQSIYYAFSALLVPTGNYYFLFTKGIWESYLEIILCLAVFFLYKDQYNIKLQTENSVKNTIKEPNRFARWSIAVLAIILIEMGIFLGYGVIASLPEDIYHMQQYSGALFIAYIILATATPLVGGIFRLQKRSLNALVLVLIGSVAFLGSTIVASAVFIPTATNNTPEVEQQFSGDELFEAINEKRKEYGVAKLQKNYWACEVAKIELDANVALGSGNFSPNESYWRAIEETQENYNSISSASADPMPNFLMEFVTYGRTLEDTIYSWKNDGSKLLFVDKSYQYGCAVTKDGYGVVVTAEEYQNESSPDVNI